MTNPSENIRKKRRDLSPYLFHFTNYEALCLILNEECIKSKRGFQCFTEAPLTSMLKLLDYMASFSKPIFDQYAIGFSRDDLFSKYNARPVILGSEQELKDIPSTYDWRKQELNVYTNDFEWLREWRIKGDFDFSLMAHENIIIVAKSEDDLDCIRYNYKLLDVFLDDDQNFIDADIEITRAYRGISMETLLKERIKNDYQLKDLLDQQEIGETIEF